MKEAANLVSKLSPHLFWDVAPEIINPSDNKKLIIKKVLEYGIWEDWLLLKEFYGIEDIAGTAKSFRELDPKSLSFISSVSGIPKKAFRCYITKQLVPQHWHF